MGIFHVLLHSICWNERLSLAAYQNVPKDSSELRLSQLILILFCLLNIVGYGQYRPADFVKKAEQITAINDDYQGMNPVLSKSGDRLWFTKLKHPESFGVENGQDVWLSERKAGEWGQPTNLLSGLNTKTNNLIIGQSNGELVYTINFDQGGQNQLSTISVFKIHVDKYVLDHQIEMQKLGLRSEFFGFFVADDESYILISMNAESSFGKEDLYVILNEEQGWTDPIHLGARVNTAGFEMSPFMSDDNSHLFFASEGHNSYGSADIFVSARLDDTWQNWSKPLNLGPNINSEGFEAYYAQSSGQNEAVFVSSKNNNLGFFYTIEYVPTNAADLSLHPSASGFIRMEKLPAMNVKLSLIDENDQIIESITTNDEGYFNLQSFLPDRDYKIAIDDSVRQDLSTADIFLTNNLGDEMVFMNQNELGLFGFKVLSGKRVEEVDKLEAMARAGSIVDKPTTISGKLATYGTLKAKVKLSVVDENSEVVEEIETDENGYFEFKTNTKEKSYFLSLNESSQGLVDVYEIFLTNDNPGEDIIVSKTEKHLFEFRALSDGSEIRMKRIAEYDRDLPGSFFDKYGYQPARDNDALTGYIKLGKLPLIDAEISLIDGQDQTLDKAITDSEGMFVFSEELPEGDYSLQLSPDQEFKLEKAEIFLANNPQDIVFYLDENRSGVFAFQKLSKKRPMTLYSLEQETEGGYVVSDQAAKIRGKFSYDRLPKVGVRLKLMDEEENVVQITDVDENGEFVFEQYTVNKNYFISVDNGIGLSDIYEIYLGEGSRNVLVNRTDKFVFAFRILPSQAILLSRYYEIDWQLGTRMRTTDDSDVMTRDYYEYDLNDYENCNYDVLEDFVRALKTGYNSKIRITNGTFHNGRFTTESIENAELYPVLEFMESSGLDISLLKIDRSASDQVILKK